MTLMIVCRHETAQSDSCGATSREDPHSASNPHMCLPWQPMSHQGDTHTLICCFENASQLVTVVCHK